MTDNAVDYSRRDKLLPQNSKSSLSYSSSTCPNRQHLANRHESIAHVFNSLDTRATSSRHQIQDRAFKYAQNEASRLAGTSSDNEVFQQSDFHYENGDRVLYASKPKYDKQVLPPPPPSPSPFILETPPNELYIPPPDRYLSPPAPAPSERFSQSLQCPDHYKQSTAYSSSSPSISIDRYVHGKNQERSCDQYHTVDHRSRPSSPSYRQKEERYNTRMQREDSRGRDLSYNSSCIQVPNPWSYPKPSVQRSLPIVRPFCYQQYESDIQHCCSPGQQDRSDLSGNSSIYSRVRSTRSISPSSTSSVALSLAPSTGTPVDYGRCPNTRYMPLQSPLSTLSRCESYTDVQCMHIIPPSRRNCPHTQEQCCLPRRNYCNNNSSFNSNCSYVTHSSSRSSTTAHGSSSSSSSLSFHHSPTTQHPSTWRSISCGYQAGSSSSNTSPINSISPEHATCAKAPLLMENSPVNQNEPITVNAATNTAISYPSNVQNESSAIHRSMSTPAGTEIIDENVNSASTTQHTRQQYEPPSLPKFPPSVKHSLQHQMSTPITANEIASSRRYTRSSSKSDVVKSYIRKETALFFGVDQATEEIEKARWLDRRKRLATRKYGKLKSEYEVPATPSGHSSSVAQPDVLPMSAVESSSNRGADEVDTSELRSGEWQSNRKPSVAKMTFSGVAYVVSTLTKHNKRQNSSTREWSRSYPPSSVPVTPPGQLDDEVFFEKEDNNISTEGPSNVIESNVDNVDGQQVYHRPIGSHRERFYTWRRSQEQRSDEDNGAQVGLSRIWSRIMDRVLDNSDRRQYGMGVVGRFFGRSFKKSVINRGPVKEQLEDLEDHRPFFTYWVTTVQMLIVALAMFAYGVGPIGFDLSHRSALVLVTSLSLQEVEYSEPSNFWIGPRAADLIHMGAKFAPCMRKDKKIIKEIEKMRDRERDTACCIRNDESGCVQASQAECSKTISRWNKWSVAENGPGGRLSGSVCGLDPKFCEAPASVTPYEWPDDITKWPICRKTNPKFPVHMAHDSQRYQKDKMTAEHMVCEVIGHPCCIGIHGTCRITTREYCDFVHGHFHEEASLCSQVSCLDDVCGMIPFWFPEMPDQFYRLWTSIFIHAGILHMTVTVFVQYFLMRDLEKLTGSLRIGIIYMGSGVAGNLASAIFVPYRADVGPAGSQFGLLACLIVEVLNSWPMLKHPVQALLKLLGITFLLFLFGLLPWVDNFAHMFGFIFGFLLSYGLLPFVSFGPYDRQKKIFLIWVCLLFSLFLFVLLILLFYLIPVYDCHFCQYLNCLPLTRDFCAAQTINFKREEYIV